MYDLSVLIPARNEQFLNHTIQDVLKNRRTKTEIIVILDGNWPVEPIPAHPDVTMVHHPESIGQRAAVNEAARLAEARFMMKLDAHCSLAPGFDQMLIESHKTGWVQVPRMDHLHAFDWVCDKCGNRTYQGKEWETGCQKCGGVSYHQEIVWKRKRHATDYMWFDRELIFRYFDNNCLKPYGGDKRYWHHGHRDWAQREITDLMTFLGACWFQEREQFLAWDGLDEGHGGWGQVGVEVACKTWLSGGALKINKKTWFAHLFRTGKGFSFPYPLPASQQEHARGYSRDLWLHDRWEGAVRPLRWLIEKFSPLPGWGRVSGDRVSGVREQGADLPLVDQPTRGVLYYTDNRLDPLIQKAVWTQLEKAGLPIVSVSLAPIPFGENIVLEKERGVLTMFEQILTGLEMMEADIVYFAEHDILYHPSHFEFFPEKQNIFYYNENRWQVDFETGKALFFYAKQTAGLVACRNLLLDHYHKRVALVQTEGFSMQMGYEPGTHNRAARVDESSSTRFLSEKPNIDIRHVQNLTPTRWEKSEFRNPRFTEGWKEADGVPGWGYTRGHHFQQLLRSITND